MRATIHRLVARLRRRPPGRDPESDIGPWEPIRTTARQPSVHGLEPWPDAAGVSWPRRGHRMPRSPDPQRMGRRRVRSCTAWSPRWHHPRTHTPPLPTLPRHRCPVSTTFIGRVVRPPGLAEVAPRYRLEGGIGSCTADRAGYAEVQRTCAVFASSATSLLTGTSALESSDEPIGCARPRDPRAISTAQQGSPGVTSGHSRIPAEQGKRREPHVPPQPKIRLKNGWSWSVDTRTPPGATDGVVSRRRGIGVPPAPGGRKPGARRLAERARTVLAHVPNEPPEIARFVGQLRVAGTTAT
jgi:hypothetical protein